jgi:hypothetical protein
MRFMLISIFGASLLWTSLVSAGGAQNPTGAPPETLLNLRRAIEANYLRYDAARTAALLQRAQGLTAEFPDSPYPPYYQAVLQTQLGNILRATDKSAALEFYREALASIESAHRLSPSTETTLWLSAVYGKLASLRNWQMLYYGAQSRSYMIEGFHQARDNPKFYLLAAVHLMHTPRIFGGDLDQAGDFLQRAKSLNADWRDSDPALVRWAAPPEVEAYQAQLEIFRGNPDRARIFIAQALDQAPDYGFVLRDLLPQLDRR